MNSVTTPSGFPEDESVYGASDAPSPPLRDEPHCHHAVDEGSEIDDRESLAQQMGWLESQLKKMSELSDLIVNLAARSDEEKLAEQINGADYELDFSRDLTQIVTDLYNLVFENEREVTDFLNRNSLAQAVISPKNANFVVRRDLNEALAARLANKAGVVLYPRAMHDFLPHLMDRKDVFDQVDVAAALKVSNKERAGALNQAIKDSDFSGKDPVDVFDLDQTASYLDGSLSMLETLGEHDVMTSCVQVPSMFACAAVLDQLRANFIEKRMRGYMLAIDDRFDCSGISRPGVPQVWAAELKANDVSVLRTQALLFQEIVGEDPLPIMREMFLFELLQVLAKCEMPIPAEYAEYSDPEMRERVLELQEDPQTRRRMKKLMDYVFETTWDSVTAEIFKQRAILAKKLEEADIDLDEAERLMGEKTQLMILKQEAFYADQVARWGEDVAAFVKAYPDPRDFVDEIMGAVDGEFPG
jgi:hypothetical protein